MPGAGNRLTVRKYQQRWLATYETKAATASESDCAGAVPTEDGYALPIDRTFIAADPGMLDEPPPRLPRHRPDDPGRIAHLRRSRRHRRPRRRLAPQLLGTRRCDQTCGIGLSIDGDDGARYIYCHGSRLNGVAVGQTVAAGELLMWSGNSGRSGAPHLHLELRIGGRQVCPQPLLQSLFETGRTVDPVHLPFNDCSF
jgi:hypothetical protein